MITAVTLGVIAAALLGLVIDGAADPWPVPQRVMPVVLAGWAVTALGALVCWVGARIERAADGRARRREERELTLVRALGDAVEPVTRLPLTRVR
jgi:urea transporter